ncbi:MAG TPA: hypothetical protein DEF77_05650, partial [Gammaproteobacteria bacterium]|nr:hypothetical protein [Gammaproteobacteria bacterium]
AIELIHEASIVHDDIQDQTTRRRGLPTVWRKFGANAALLLGDHLVAAAFRSIAEAPDIDSIKTALMLELSESVSRAASGQHLQLTNETGGDAEGFYVNVAINKTGALLALPLQFASLFNRKVASDTMAARRCGEQLGLAYQILDDLKPYAKPGKLAHDEDMQNRVITAPVAACTMLFPHVDPFSTLIKRTDLRDKAIRECQRWLDTALANARYETTFLDQAVAAVVEQFIGQRLSQKLAPPIQITPSYANYAAQASARVEAV